MRHDYRSGSAVCRSARYYSVQRGGTLDLTRGKRVVGKLKAINAHLQQIGEKLDELKLNGARDELLAQLDTTNHLLESLSLADNRSTVSTKVEALGLLLSDIRGQLKDLDKLGELQHIRAEIGYAVSGRLAVVIKELQSTREVLESTRSQGT